MFLPMIALGYDTLLALLSQLIRTDAASTHKVWDCY